MRNIRYAAPPVNHTDYEAIRNSVSASFRNGWFGFGDKCREFEREFAKYVGSANAVFVNSGSSANLLAVASLCATRRLARGDRIATTACTFPTTLNPILLYGLKPVFVDIVLPQWSIDTEGLKKAVEIGATGIILPHLNGIPHRMDEVCSIIRRDSLSLIEDACDALGSKFGKKQVGTFGNLGTFSFYVAHHMTTGEGGMVVTDEVDLSGVLRSMRDWGRVSERTGKEMALKRQLIYQSLTKRLPPDYESRYTYAYLGFNVKPLELQGAWGLSQLKKLPRIIARRKSNFRRLAKSLRRYSDYIILAEPPAGTDVSWFWFPIVVRQGSPFSRRDIVSFLEKRGIETRPILAGNIMMHPAYADMKSRTIGNMTNTDLVMREGFIVGVHPGLTIEELEYVESSFDRFFHSLPK